MDIVSVCCSWSAVVAALLLANLSAEIYTRTSLEWGSLKAVCDCSGANGRSIKKFCAFPVAFAYTLPAAAAGAVADVYDKAVKAVKAVVQEIASSADGV